MRASHLFGPHFISETKYHHYFWESLLILADIRPICKNIYKHEANCWATSGQIQQIWSTLFWKIGEHIVKICELLEFGAVQKRVNRVDLKKCCTMNLYLQTSASIQLRTSPPNSYFDMCSSPNCRVQISYVGVLTCRPGERNQVAVLRFESGSVHLRKKMPALAEWPLTQP